MAEPFRNGAPAPSESLSAPTAPPALSFDPTREVLQQQRVAVKTLSVRSLTQDVRPKPDRELSTHDRVRLIDLAIKVLRHAMLQAEAQCRSIVGAAETQAAIILQEARDDVGPRSSPPAASVDDMVATSPHRPKPSRLPSRLPSLSDAADPHGEIGDDFFDSESGADPDPWRFMDDDLVGTGPAILRWVRRRPPGSRQQPTE